MPLSDSVNVPACALNGSDSGGAGDGAGRVLGRSVGGSGEGNVDGLGWGTALASERVGATMCGFPKRRSEGEKEKTGGISLATLSDRTS